MNLQGTASNSSNYIIFLKCLTIRVSISLASKEKKPDYSLSPCAPGIVLNASYKLYAYSHFIFIYLKACAIIIPIFHKLILYSYCTILFLNILGYTHLRIQTSIGLYYILLL